MGRAGVDGTGQEQADWRHPVVLAIFVMCLVPEVLLSGADWGLWGSPRWRLWAFQNAGFWSGLLHNWRPNYAVQPWTMFLTYGFLHAGAVHFLVNMTTLVSLGPPLADRHATGTSSQRTRDAARRAPRPSRLTP